MAHTLLYFLALFCLSTSSSWTKLNQMPVEVIGFYRLIIAATVVGLWTFLIKKNNLPKFNKKFLWVILSGFFFFLHLWSYKFAAKNTTISNTMILFQTTPIWSTMGGVLFFSEKITRRLVLSYVMALSGILILFGQNADFSSLTFYGDISALASGLLYSAYMLAGKQARLFYDNNIYATFQYLICGTLFLILTLVFTRPLIGYSGISWFSIVGQVLLPTLLGHFLFTYLVKYMNLGFMTCGKLIEPIFAAIIAYFIFQEQLKPATWVAFLLTGLSILILFVPGLIKNRKINNELDQVLE